MREIKIYGSNQKQLECVVHNKIHDLNKALKNAIAEYNDFENAPDKVKRVYKSKDEYKRRVIDRLHDNRKYYIKRLSNIRKGIITE